MTRLVFSGVTKYVKWLVLPFLTITTVSGCHVTRWTQVQIASDPAPAVVTIEETGNTVAVAPGLYEIPAKFMYLEPRHLFWTFTFRRTDSTDDRVRVELSEWYKTRDDAKHQPNPPRVYGVLKPIPK